MNHITALLLPLIFQYRVALCRVANVRKHQLLKPDLKMIITAIDSITPRYGRGRCMCLCDPSHSLEGSAQHFVFCCCRAHHTTQHNIIRGTQYTHSNYVFEHLAIEDVESQQTNLQLGFPANVTHVVRPDSPLYNLRCVLCVAYCA